MKSSLGQHFCFLLGVYCTKDTQEEGALEMVGGGQAYTPQVASSMQIWCNVNRVKQTRGQGPRGEVKGTRVL